MAEQSLDGHREEQQIEFAEDRPRLNGRGARRRASSSTEQGLDLLADERTKEVLDKIGTIARIDDSNLRIVVVGKTGVGKTTLIRGLFENNVLPHEAVDRTEDIQSRTFDIDSPSGHPIAVMVTDTPGTEALVGVGSKANRKQYVQRVSDCIAKAEIILYCLRMDDYVNERDVETMRFFLKEFGDTMWAKVIIVLTCANKVLFEIPEEFKQQVFDEKFTSTRKEILKAMKQAGITQKVSEATAVCVAGSPWNKSLPGCDDWVCPFLVNCLKSAITDNTKAALLHSTWKRWISTRRTITGTAGGAGVATGLGLIVIGGVMAVHPVGLPLGVPLIVVGSGISIYSASASAAQTTRTEIKHSKDIKTVNKIQNLQPGDHLQ